MRSAATCLSVWLTSPCFRCGETNTAFYCAFTSGQLPYMS